MLTASAPQDLLKELATACSWKISYCHWSFHLLLWWGSKCTSKFLSIFQQFPANKLLVLLTRIEIKSNWTLVCFNYYFDFIIYFCIRPSCFFIYMISSQSNYVLILKCEIFLFLLLKWWSIFFRTFAYDPNTSEVISNGI